jgi:prolyl-tRNA synthetase
VGGGKTALAVVRGDHDVTEIKLARALGVGEVALAEAHVVKKVTGAAVGFAGPVGLKDANVVIIIDHDAANVADGISGGNETDVHLKHVAFGRDFQGTRASLRSAVDGDPCPECGGSLKLYRGIEGGHIFMLGTHYSRLMNATYLDKDQKKQHIVMGCYGIGVSRLVAAAVEQHFDEGGIRWPASIAPYDVHIVQLGEEDEVKEAIDALEKDLEALGVEVLIDDRKERPGVKFKDADLIGIPLRVTLGARGLKTGTLELKPRSEPDPKQAENLPLDKAAQILAERVRAALGAATTA